MTQPGTAGPRHRATPAPRACLGLALLALCGGLGPLAAPAAAASSRPDRALFEEARAGERALRASTRLASRRAEWEKVVLAYRRVVARYPKSGYCDDALLEVGDLYREMARRFKLPRLNDDAVAAYRTLVQEYPSSRLGEQALYSSFEIAVAGKDRKRASEVGEQYLGAFPDARRAAEVKRRLKLAAPEKAAALPKPPPPGLAGVFDLRSWSGDASTRVVLDVEREVPIKHDRIGNPERLWVDLVGARLHPNLKDRSFPVADGLLEQVRVGQNRDDVVRVVLDFRGVGEHTIFYLQDPTRLVIDVRSPQRAGPAVAEAGPAAAAPARVAEASPEPAPARSPSPAPAPRPEPTPQPAAAKPSARPAVAAPPAAKPQATPTPEPEPTPLPLPTRRVAAVVQATPAPARSEPVRRSPPPLLEGPAEPRKTASVRAPARRETPPAPEPPQVNRAGSYSLARQLGLGARRIVIDAGHGGHDPGTIGRGGLQEKDLVLDVALRLERLVQAELGAEVVLTRSNDVFIPLEERTAIANSKGADLFLSIHANSSRNPQARGIETYFLNFARNAHAESVAARENAISEATLKDLQNLVKAITLNSKIDESRDFAASIQEAMITSLKPRYAGAVDRGVHTAPFYVLIGANMPSVLAEIAFVSNPEDERLLRQPGTRDHIAESLLDGVRAYLNALSRTQSRQLTAATGASTVPRREGRRR